jgi:Trk K+ transport system NAD-binding subunit
VDVLLFGLGRYGAAVASNLREPGCRLLAVDFDPEMMRRHIRDGYAVHYGDVEDPEFIASLPLEQVQWVVSTMRDRTINRILLHGLRQQGYPGKAALSAPSRHEAQQFEREGVDLIFVPHAESRLQTNQGVAV